VNSTLKLRGQRIH